MVPTLTQRQQWMRFLAEEAAPDPALPPPALAAAAALFDLLERCAMTQTMVEADRVDLGKAMAKLQTAAPGAGSPYVDGLLLAARSFLGDAQDS